MTRYASGNHGGCVNGPLMGTVRNTPMEYTFSTGKGRAAERETVVAGWTEITYDCRGISRISAFENGQIQVRCGQAFWFLCQELLNEPDHLEVVMSSYGMKNRLICDVQRLLHILKHQN